MSKFNSSISVIGIAEVKVQQAVLKLLENSIYQRELISKTGGMLAERLRRTSQKISELSPESVAWSHVGTDLDNAEFAMAGLVGNADATYNLKVTFRNREAAERQCLVNGVPVQLGGTVGAMASRKTTIFGNGTFTVDNIASSVDVFIRIWR